MLRAALLGLRLARLPGLLQHAAAAGGTPGLPSLGCAAPRGRGRAYAPLAARAAAKKDKTAYVCEQCGYEHLQRMGQCRECGAWNSLKRITVVDTGPEGAPRGGGGGIAAARAALARRAAAGGLFTLPSAAPSSSSGGGNGAPAPRYRGAWMTGGEGARAQAVPLSQISSGAFKGKWRQKLTGEFGAEVGRVIGGGIVPGSLVLVGGEPGVGKSTLLLQLASLLSTCSPAPGASPAAPVVSEGDSEEPPGVPVLYASAEESVEQVAARAERLGLHSQSHVSLLAATDLEGVLGAMAQPRAQGGRPFGALVLDSIQTVFLDSVAGSAGSITQVKECAGALLQVAKGSGVTVFLVGHVTKDDKVAGPRTLEHMVDTVLFMEGDRHQSYRLLRTTKNRYGATDEVGVFSMTDRGLVSVPNPSAMFLAQRSESPDVASCVTATVEGTRPILLEVQALASPAGEGQSATQQANGMKDRQRLIMLLAVLAKHTGMPVRSCDIWINVPGGLKIQEPASDLALCLAVASSVMEKPLAPGLAAVGEVGLGGELRAVTAVGRRVAEAAKMGLQTVIVPAKGEAVRAAGVKVVPCATLREALKAAGLPQYRRPPKPEA